MPAIKFCLPAKSSHIPNCPAPFTSNMLTPDLTKSFNEVIFLGFPGRTRIAAPRLYNSVRVLLSTNPGCCIANCVSILDVNGAGQLGMWEDLAGKQNLIAGIQKNIKKSFPNTALAIDAWKTDNSYDAIISYTSWYLRLKDVSQLVKIPPAQTVYRGTPVAITTITNQKKEAQEFIRFMLSDEGHAIFKKWGWE